MVLCRVIGTVVSQEKEACLVGKKLLLCETRDQKNKRIIVGVDMVGAGQGADVLVSHQSHGQGNDYVDDWIVAIVDSINEQK